MPTLLGNLPREEYTPWIARVGAAIIDWIPAVVISAIGWIALFAIPSTYCYQHQGNLCREDGNPLGPFVWLITGLLTITYWLWNRGFRQGTTGASIGKSVLRIRLVSEATGQPIGFGMALLREMTHIVDAVICYVGFLFPLWDAKRQTLADKMVSTVVLSAASTWPRRSALGR